MRRDGASLPFSYPRQPEVRARRWRTASTRRPWPDTGRPEVMVVVVVGMAVVVASVVGVVIVAARWAMSARILVEPHLRFLGVSVLVGSSDHLTDASGRLAVEFGAKLAMVESSDEGGDDLSFRDVGNRVPLLGKASNVAVEELGRLLVDAVEIMLGAWLSTRGHIVVGEDFL